MNFESSQDRLKRNHNDRRSGEKVAPEKRAEAEKMLANGTSPKVIASELGMSNNTAIAIRNKMEDDKGVGLAEWKKDTARVLSQVVSKGANRLLSEVENIPPGQLPLALAILTDKVMQLQDAPTTVVEHRLRVSHDDINRMLKGQADIVDITPQKISEKGA